MEKDCYIGFNLPKLMEMRKDMENDQLFLEWFMQMEEEVMNTALKIIFEDKPFSKTEET